jgi:hypothetical protein
MRSVRSFRRSHGTFRTAATTIKIEPRMTLVAKPNAILLLR